MQEVPEGVVYYMERKCKLIKEHRQAENRRGEIRQAVMEAEIQEEIERFGRRKDDSRKSVKLKKRESDLKTRRTRGRRQFGKRGDALHLTTLSAVDFSRPKRTRGSQQVKSAHCAQGLKSNWDDIEKKAVESARHEAEQFLKTSDGKEMMQIEVTRLQEDAEMMQKTKSKGAETQEGSSEKVLRSRVQDYFSTTRRREKKYRPRDSHQTRHSSSQRPIT